MQHAHRLRAFVVLLTTTACIGVQETATGEHGARSLAVGEDTTGLPPRIRTLEEADLQPVVAPERDEFGYPAARVDRLTPIRLFKERNFDALDSLLAALTDSALRDIRNEYVLVDACVGLETVDTTLARNFDRWVARRGGSPYAQGLRAGFLLQGARRARGERLARETPEEAFRFMGQRVQLAVEDAAVAIEENPRHLCAYETLIGALLLGGSRLDAEAVLEHALEVFPGSMELRWQFMGHLEPRWGGSYEAMDAFAEDAASRVGLNPRLASLRGASADERGYTAALADQTSEAIRQYDRAIAVAGEARFLRNRARLYHESSDLIRALRDVIRARKQHPFDRFLLESHGRILLDISRSSGGAGRVTAAFRSVDVFKLLVELNPNSAEAKELLAKASEWKEKARLADLRGQ